MVIGTSKLTIALVYVLGRARANHHPKPLMKPLPFADTYQFSFVPFTWRVYKLTRSLTIRPSSLATITLNTVLRTRKNVCNNSINVSLPVLLFLISLFPFKNEIAERPTLGRRSAALLGASSRIFCSRPASLPV